MPKPLGRLEVRFHDYHLRGYSVLDRGERIVLDLIYDYPSSAKCESRIEFDGVVCYDFTQTTGAIITDIYEVDLKALVSEESALLISFAHWHAPAHWESGSEEYASALTAKGKKAWRLESAIGFAGFVIDNEVTGTP